MASPDPTTTNKAKPISTPGTNGMATSTAYAATAVMITWWTICSLRGLTSISRISMTQWLKALPAQTNRPSTQSCAAIVNQRRRRPVRPAPDLFFRSLMPGN